MKSISMIHRCIGVSGLNGLDRLLCYNIIAKMRYILKLIPRETGNQEKKLLNDCFNELKSLTSFNDKYEKIYFTLKKTYRELFFNQFRLNFFKFKRTLCKFDESYIIHWPMHFIKEINLQRTVDDCQNRIK